MVALASDYPLDEVEALEEEVKHEQVEKEDCKGSAKGNNYTKMKNKKSAEEQRLWIKLAP